MKKITLSILTIFMCVTLIPEQTVQAESFAGQEKKYIKLCSSQSLSKSKQKKCKKFNSYLDRKNNELQKEMKEAKNNINDIKEDILSVQNKMENIERELETLQTDIQILKKSINSFEKKVEKKDNEMGERMYAMQTQYNSNMWFDFIMGSQSMNDIFSRYSSYKQIIKADEEEIEELKTQKEQLTQQKKSLDLKKQQVLKKKKEQNALKVKYNKMLKEENTDYNSAKGESKEVTAAQKRIDENLTRMYEESLKEQSSTNTGQIANDGTKGATIVNKALSRQGCRYWWGAPGGGFGDGQGLNNPNARYFDCSGLVAWAHRQSGVKIGRTTAAGYSRSGKSVSYNNLKPGDVITFNYGGGVAHIGIYIGNGQMVHASGKGSGTRGQDPNQCVKVTSIRPGSYFYKYIYNCRRLW